ncbi:MAG: GPR endopeptidase, partial [Clostridium sp.]|nr:GPR endopeptidase [Clostridium sp.]
FFFNITNVEAYLTGNDPDTIEFVYNMNHNITDFPKTPGESIKLERKTPYYIQWDNRWAYDALGSRKLERVNRTIQISDTGISPGAGVGNHRMKINEEVLGVKVIAIGVPTVVHASTIANDTIDLLLDELISKAESGKEFYNMLKSVDKVEKSNLIKEILDPFVGDLMVTPKDVDAVIESLAKIIANGINMAVQPNLDMEDINKFMN